VLITPSWGCSGHLTQDRTFTGPDVRATGLGRSPTAGGRRFGSATSLPPVAAV
jgi:hypothetical protein